MIKFSFKFLFKISDLLDIKASVKVLDNKSSKPKKNRGIMIVFFPGYISEDKECIILEVLETAHDIYEIVKREISTDSDSETIIVIQNMVFNDSCDEVHINFSEDMGKLDMKKLDMKKFEYYERVPNAEAMVEDISVNSYDKQNITYGTDILDSIFVVLILCVILNFIKREIKKEIKKVMECLRIALIIFLFILMIFCVY